MQIHATSRRNVSYLFLLFKERSCWFILTSWKANSGLLLPTGSGGKANASPCNVVCASSREAKTDVPSLTDSEEETIVFVAELNAPLVAETRSGQSYLKKYDEMVANPPKATPEPTKQSTKQPVKK